MMSYNDTFELSDLPKFADGDKDFHLEGFEIKNPHRFDAMRNNCKSCYCLIIR